MSSARFKSRLAKLEAKRAEAEALCPVRCQQLAEMDSSKLSDEQAARFESFYERPRVKQTCPHCGLTSMGPDFRSWTDEDLDDFLHLWELGGLPLP